MYAPGEPCILPVEEINIYPDGTTTEDGSLKDEYVETGTEETLLTNILKTAKS